MRKPSLKPLHYFNLLLCASLVLLLWLATSEQAGSFFYPLWSRLLVSAALVSIGSISVYRLLLDNASNRHLSLAARSVHSVTLQHYFSTIIGLLRKERLQNLLSRKPTKILMLGKALPNNSKLLQFTELKFNNIAELNRLARDSDKQQPWISLWRNQQELFIVPRSDICFAESFIEQQAWLKQLYYFKSHHALAIDAITLTVSVDQLKNYRDKSFIQFCDLLAKQLQLLCQQRKPLPINILILGCENLEGFQEFFADLNQDEKSQALGFNLSNNPGKTVSHYIGKQFDYLLQQLNQQTLWRLHREQQVENRLRVKKFSQELSQLQSGLSAFLTQLNTGKTYNWHNVCFIGKNQYPSLTYETNPNNSSLATEKSKQTRIPLFLSGALQQIRQFTNYQIHKKYSRLWGLWLGLLVGFTALTGGLLFYYFKQDEHFITVAEQQLNLASGNTNILQELEHLNHARQAITTDKLNKQIIQFPNVKKLANRINKKYKTILQQNFSQYLLNTLGATLQADLANKDNHALYQDLTIYLMLSNVARRNNTNITQWFANYWQNQASLEPHTKEFLTKYLNDFLNLTHLSVAVDNDLVIKARQQLAKLPAAKLIYFVFTNQDTQRILAFSNNSTLSTLTTINSITVPEIYQHHVFDRILNTGIAHFVQEPPTQDWVLGKAINIHQLIEQKSNNLNELLAHLRDFYVADYTKIWRNAINRVVFVHQNQPQKIISIIQLMLDKNSPLAQLINDNTNMLKNNLQAIGQWNTDTINNPFMAMTVNHQNNHASLPAILENLKGYLNSVENTSNHQETNYNLAILRFNASSQKKSTQVDALTKLFKLNSELPKPLHQWLKVIADSTWKYVLDDAHSYIDKQWQKQIVPIYQQKIAGKFPLVNNAVQSVSADNFHHFFGPHGVIEHFFNTYVIPFVNLQHSYWTWKTLDQQTLPTSQRVLDMLIRASMIQKMFYADQQLKQPHYDFSLSPIRLSKNVAQFSLNAAGQRLIVHATEKKNLTQSFHWPNTKDNFVTIRFTDKNNTQNEITVTDFWSWFNLLKHYASVKPTKNPAIYQVTFKLDNDSANLLLRSKHAINPLLPEILAKFSCPEHF